MAIEPITVQNTTTGARHTMHARTDRLDAYIHLEIPTFEESLMPGISGAAALGLSTIFVDIPYRFPVESLLKLLEMLDGRCSFGQVEKRLEIMAGQYPQIDCEGNDLV